VKKGIPSGLACKFSFLAVVSAEYHQQQLILPTITTLIIMTMERPQCRIKKQTVSEAATVSEIDPIILKETAAKRTKYPEALSAVTAQPVPDSDLHFRRP
jgi:hypothetical protein